MIIESTPRDSGLELDAGSIDPAELSMGALTREINLRRRPPALLRFMMNALENKRRQKLLGWSRPWNKTGMTVFRTHGHLAGPDGEFMSAMEKAFWEACGEMPSPFREFASELWSDPLRMAFTFYHNSVDSGREYEGLTLSLGRKVREDKTKRDRIDIILEDQRVGGAVDNKPDRIRFIVNPFSQWMEGKTWSKEYSSTQIHEGLAGLYSRSLDFYRLYRDDPGRQWNHWAFRYIDYFGPRTFIPPGSAFL